MRNAGEYSKKITIVRTENAEIGGFSKIKDPSRFTDVLLTWAKVRTTKGFTLIASGSDFEKAYTNFTIPMPRVELDRGMYVLYNDRIYSIEYLNNIDEADIELEIQAKEVTK